MIITRFRYTIFPRQCNIECFVETFMFRRNIGYEDEKVNNHVNTLIRLEVDAEQSNLLKIYQYSILIDLWIYVSTFKIIVFVSAYQCVYNTLRWKCSHHSCWCSYYSLAMDKLWLVLLLVGCVAFVTVPQVAEGKLICYIYIFLSSRLINVNCMDTFVLPLTTDMAETFSSLESAPLWPSGSLVVESGRSLFSYHA